MRSPLRSYRPAPISPSTSLSISNCSTASATARRKSPSPAFSSSSASITLSSVIVSSRVLQVEVLQLHLSRPDRWPPQPHRSTLRVHPKIPPPAGTLTRILSDRRFLDQLPAERVAARAAPTGPSPPSALSISSIERRLVSK